jgi:hypothetical protein
VHQVALYDQSQRDRAERADEQPVATKPNRDKETEARKDRIEVAYVLGGLHGTERRPRPPPATASFPRPPPPARASTADGNCQVINGE